jgi:inward rectifier potassium channel
MAEHRHQADEQDPDTDLGFGVAIGSRAKRLINPNGTFNVKRVGTSWRQLHLYHYLIGISWIQFWLILVGFYLLLNALFAGIYLLIGVSQISGVPPGSMLSDFAYAFYFSVQTFTTVGYGSFSPMSHPTSIVASFEAMMGLIGFAFATGLLYGRFARPTAKILFSENILVAPYREGLNGLMFRITNGRKNQLIELDVKVILSWFNNPEEQRKRSFVQLELERDHVSLFPLSWTIVHPIDEDSPLQRYSPEELARSSPEFMILIKGYDDTFAQEVHARMSYKNAELIWAAKFEPMFYVDDEGETVLEVDKLNTWRKARLNG